MQRGEFRYVDSIRAQDQFRPARADRASLHSEQRGKSVTSLDKRLRDIESAHLALKPFRDVASGTAEAAANVNDHRMERGVRSAIGDAVERLLMAGYRRLADAIIQQKTTLTGRSRSS